MDRTITATNNSLM